MQPSPPNESEPADAEASTSSRPLWIKVAPVLVVGAGLGHVFDRGETPDMRLLFDPQVYLPLFGLAFLSLVPILVHAWRLRRRRQAVGDAAR